MADHSVRSYTIRQGDEGKLADEVMQHEYPGDRYSYGRRLPS